MRFYRIADSRHSPESGEGARLHGGRWNSPGRAVIYACETQTGAILEKLVHTNGRMPKHQVCVIFEAPDSLKVASLEAKSMPGWATRTWSRAARRAMPGSRRHRLPYCACRASSSTPSATYSINPEHPDFRRIKVAGTEPVRWDERLFTENRIPSPPRALRL